MATPHEFGIAGVYFKISGSACRQLLLFLSSRFSGFDRFSQFIQEAIMAKKSAPKKAAKRNSAVKKAPVRSAKARIPAISDRLRGRQIPHIGVLSASELHEIIALGEWFRDHPLHPAYSDLLKGRVQALLFVFALKDFLLQKRD